MKSCYSTFQRLWGLGTFDSSRPCKISRELFEYPGLQKSWLTVVYISVSLRGPEWTVRSPFFHLLSTLYSFCRDPYGDGHFQRECLAWRWEMVGENLSMLLLELGGVGQYVWGNEYLWSDADERTEWAWRLCDIIVQNFLIRALQLEFCSFKFTFHLCFLCLIYYYPKHIFSILDLRIKYMWKL